MAKKKNTRPVLIQPCDSTEDHPKHPWRFSEKWPDGVFWHCPGYNRVEVAERVRATARAIKKTQKKG